MNKIKNKEQENNFKYIFLRIILYIFYVGCFIYGYINYNEDLIYI